MGERLDYAELRRTVNATPGTGLLAVTLREGDLLLGGLGPVPGLDRRFLNLMYNGPHGRAGGHQHIVRIPLELVAALTLLSLDTPAYQVAPRHFPNPLASILYEHNQSVAGHNPRLIIESYIERAFSRAAIPPDGIHLGRDTLLYADWAFLAQVYAPQDSVTLVPLPFVELSRSLHQSLETLAGQWLKAIKNRSRMWLPETSMTGHYLAVNGFVHGQDLAQGAQIEGEEVHLWKVVDVGTDTPYAVVLKDKLLKFPSDMLAEIRSELSFYGEILPIPVRLFESNYPEVLLVRLVGYATYE